MPERKAFSPGFARQKGNGSPIGFGMPVNPDIDGRNYIGWFVLPAEDFEFTEDEAQSVTIGAYVDATYEFSFDAFLTTVGTITTSGGAGTGNITPVTGDIGETSLEFRPIGETAALASLACTVVGA